MFLRKKATEFCIDANKVAICGFSAGGHLCGSMAVHYDSEELVLRGEYKEISNRPDAVILSYPVITSGEFAHKYSFKALLGEDATEEELEFMSLEKQVKKSIPPVFLWHTATDGTVPVENSYLFADACKEKGVPFELHVFGNGAHGLSLANKDWASGNYSGDYTMQQFFETIKFLMDNHMELPPLFNMMGKIPEGVSFEKWILQGMKQFSSQSQADDGIAVWPELAHNWLKKKLNI